MAFFRAASRVHLAVWLLPLALACKEDSAAPISCPAASAADKAGRCLPTCVRTADCLITEGCVEGVCTPNEYLQPTVVVLSADPLVVPVGGESEIRYLAQGADEVTITVLDATMPLGQSSQGDPVSDRRVISQITEDTTVLITAETSDGRMGNAEVTIQVEGNVGDEVTVSRFTASPNRVSPGDAIELSWTVLNGSENGVRIEKDGFAWLEGLATSGTKEDFPQQSTTYRLIAQGDSGMDDAEVTVTVVEDDGPEITDLGITPESRTIVQGSNAVLWWSTSGADQVMVTGPQGSTEFTTQIPELVSNGAWLLAPPEGTSEYTVRASAMGGTPSAGSKALTVRPWPIAPRIVQPTVNPPILPVNARDQMVTVSWTVTPANADVEVRWGNGTHRTTGSGSHSFPVDGEETTSLELRAFAPEGLAHVVPMRILAQGREAEPNDLESFASELTNYARSGQMGRGGTELDVDWYEVVVPEAGRLHSAIQAMCPVGLRMELHRAGFGQAIAVSETQMMGNCPEITQEGMQAGTYRLRVTQSNNPSQTSPLPYMIRAYVFGPQCGNGQHEYGEQCDVQATDFSGPCTPACRFNESHRYEAVERSRSAAVRPARTEPTVFTSYGAGDPDDAGVAVVPLPFGFEYFGRTFHGLALFTDGFISFLPFGADATSPTDFVGPTAPNAVIAPFIADLKIWNEGIFTWLDTSSNGRRFVIDMPSLTFAASPNAKLGAQIHLYEDGRIGIIYTDVATSNGGGLRVGIEGPEGQIQVTLPGCENGCSPDAINGKYFELVHPPEIVEPGGN